MVYIIAKSDTSKTLSLGVKLESYRLITDAEERIRSFLLREKLAQNAITFHCHTRNMRSSMAIVNNYVRMGKEGISTPTITTKSYKPVLLQN